MIYFLYVSYIQIFPFLRQDENDDGVLTVQELIKWIETNKLVQLESEGRDADMDRIMEKRSQKDENSPSDSREKEDKA